jgi:hypothetical protein
MSSRQSKTDSTKRADRLHSFKHDTHSFTHCMQARDLLEALCDSRYAQVISALDAMQPVLELDMHLSRCVPAVLGMIRNKVLQQYVQPYHSLRLPQMAQELGMPLEVLEPKLISLIVTGAIPARVDSVSKV